MMDSVRLLVSVRSAAEAGEALSGGADIIDAKEPAGDRLAPVDAQTLDEIIAVVDGQRPVSVASEAMAAARDWPKGLAYLKIGTAGLLTRPRWTLRLAHAVPLRPAAPPGVVVTYADARRVGAPEPRDVLHWALGRRPHGVMIDTAVKDGSNLFDWRTDDELADCVARARQAGLLVGLAGSLAGESFARAVRLRPDVIGVRGGACRDEDRQSRVDAARVAQLKRIIEACEAPRALSAGRDAG